VGGKPEVEAVKRLISKVVHTKANSAVYQMAEDGSTDAAEVWGLIINLLQNYLIGRVY
jgi:hypothetical protein